MKNLEKERKNLLLLLQFEEFGLWPKFSITQHFRIMGEGGRGWWGTVSVKYRHTEEKKNLVSNIQLSVKGEVFRVDLVVFSVNCEIFSLYCVVLSVECVQIIDCIDLYQTGHHTHTHGINKVVPAPHSCSLLCGNIVWGVWCIVWCSV